MKILFVFFSCKIQTMTSHLKTGLTPVVLLLLSTSIFAQQIRAFNQNSSRTNRTGMMMPGYDFRISPQYGINLNGNSTDSLFFRGNGPAFKMNAGYSFGHFVIGLSSGFLSSSTDKTKINEFISRTGIPTDQLIISSSNQQSMYLLLGPAAEFGNRVHAGIHAKGGLFINNGGFVNIQRRGATSSLYRNEPSSKSIFPGFTAGFNIDYSISDYISLGFGTDFLSTKNEVVNYDIRRSGGSVNPEAIKLSKNVSSMLAGVNIRYNISSPRDAQSGQASGKRQKDVGSGLSTGQRQRKSQSHDVSGIASGKRQHKPLQVPRDQGSGLATGKTYQPGQPQYGNISSTESCGPVSIKTTHTDGTTEEMTFSCPEDAAAFKEKISPVKQKPWLPANFRTVSNDASTKGIVSGKVVWISPNSGTGIITNRTIRGGSINMNSQTSSTRTTPNNSFGTMVRLHAREAGSGQASGKRQFEPIYIEGQETVCNPCLATVSNPIYKANQNTEDCDDTEPGISNLKVSLVDPATDKVVATTFTEKCGDFFFGNVPYGIYAVQLTGSIGGKKGYDINLNSKTEIEGDIIWGENEIQVRMHSDGAHQTEAINTSRSNIKNLFLIEADLDGDGEFESLRAHGNFSDGTTMDITNIVAASRVNKIEGLTLKHKALQFPGFSSANMTRASKGAQISEIIVSGIEGNVNGGMKITAAFSDGSSWDITRESQIISHANVRQTGITVADLDGDGMADAVINTSRSNIKNQKLAATGMENDDMIWSPRSNTELYSITLGDLDGDGKAERTINTSRSNIKNFRVSAADLDGDGRPDAAINSSNSNIKNLRISAGDINGDGRLDIIAGSKISDFGMSRGTELRQGDPVHGVDVKLGIKSRGKEESKPVDENGRVKVIETGMEPGSYVLWVNTDILIDDETIITVGDSRKGWDGTIKGNMKNNEGIATREEGVQRAGIKQTMQTKLKSTAPLKWMAPEALKKNINSSKTNLKSLESAVSELETMINSDQNTTQVAINNTKSNIKAIHDRIAFIETILDNIEMFEKDAVMDGLNIATLDMDKNFAELQKLVNSLGRQYTTISNVLKTKHDTAKNSIGNIR